MTESIRRVSETDGENGEKRKKMEKMKKAPVRFFSLVFLPLL
jgi:hypothetical protein